MSTTTAPSPQAPAPQPPRPEASPPTRARPEPVGFFSAPSGAAPGASSSSWCAPS
ncbi:hypothetical protein [Luteimicrobium album]|uniref:hypothetical protein n=1 Tax=Luteimicrobium album TaxID=1054550 RepID=UPI0024E0F96D|nr:hypothetical protein [Luteimicrobium album]